MQYVFQHLHPRAHALDLLVVLRFQLREHGVAVLAPGTEVKTSAQKSPGVFVKKSSSATPLHLSSRRRDSVSSLTRIRYGEIILFVRRSRPVFARSSHAGAAAARTAVAIAAPARGGAAAAAAEAARAEARRRLAAVPALAVPGVVVEEGGSGGVAVVQGGVAESGVKG